MTYVLYHFESNYDGGEFAILAVSKDKEKLEQLRAEYTNNKRYNDEINLKSQLKHEEHYKKVRDGVKAFLMKNWDALREYDKYRGMGVTKKDWHNPPGFWEGAYHPDVIQKKKEEIVEKVSNNDWNLFYKTAEKIKNRDPALCKILFLDKLVGPPYDYSEELGPAPQHPSSTEYKYPAYDDLTIEGFEEL